ncbi:ComF family protein [Alkalihalobacterium alkalinitrilicum]|uniref:ComF family protein n=1 Tax=Alkalihalobacterium alkalinitrilicum TaxID=427920 RepID=UPI0009949088|nr:ComF family protein [Alkalihalobacterium alkalinitrilicum]
MSNCLYCFAPNRSQASWASFWGLEKEDMLCESCRAKLDHLAEPLCQLCDRSLRNLASDFHDGKRCRDCMRWEQAEEWRGVLMKNRSLYPYNAFVKDVMAQYKYRGDYALAQLFTEKLRFHFRGDFNGRLLVPIPLSEERLYERGFNQAEALAWLIGEPVLALERRHHEEKQSKKKRSERIHRKENPFALVKSFQAQITSQQLLLVDDIYTTGATLRYAAKVLIDSGAKSVSALTIARG